MSLSARRLGERYGLTAEEMNVLLKEEGFLKGAPGDYYPTEKGKAFVTEKGDDNGYGGYAFRGWNWLEWDESIIDELNVTTDRKREIREITAEQRRLRSAKKKAESEAYWSRINASKEIGSEEMLPENGADNHLGTLILGGVALIGYGVYKVIKYFIKDEN